MTILVVCLLQLVGSQNSQRIEYELLPDEAQSLASQFGFKSARDVRFQSTACAHIEDVTYEMAD